MIHLPYAKLIGAGVVVIAVSIGIYRVYDAGRDSVQEKWDVSKRIQEAALAAAVADKLQVENEWKRREKESVDAVQKKLAAANVRASDLASRLRRYYAGSGPVSQSPATPTGSPGTGPVRSDTDEADALVREHLAACEVDGGWLNYWIERYRLTSAPASSTGTP